MSRLPVKTGASLPAVKSAGSTPDVPHGPGIGARQRDFLLLTIFVLTQQGYVDRAGVLAEALHLMGETSAEVLLARAVLRFLSTEWSATLACLDDLDRADPIERFGAYVPTPAQRMRRFMAARCHYALGDTARARDALNVYLRHGTEASER